MGVFGRKKVDLEFKGGEPLLPDDEYGVKVLENGSADRREVTSGAKRAGGGE